MACGLLTDRVERVPVLGVAFVQSAGGCICCSVMNRKKSGRRAVNRLEVLELAGRLFAEHGYRSTSLEAVSEQLGVTRQALYYHFESKDEILGALFDELMTKFETAVQSAAVGPGTREPRFVAMLGAHIDVAVTNSTLVALLLHERPEIARLRKPAAAKRRRDYAKLFIAAYEEGVAAGVFEPLDPWAAVNTLISAANGVSWWYQGEPASGAKPGGTTRDSLCELLSNGVILAEAPAVCSRGSRGAALAKRAAAIPAKCAAEA